MHKNVGLSDGYTHQATPHSYAEARYCSSELQFCGKGVSDGYTHQTYNALSLDRKTVLLSSNDRFIVFRSRHSVSIIHSPARSNPHPSRIDRHGTVGVDPGVDLEKMGKIVG